MAHSGGFMQRIMIVSDSHRRHGNLAEAIYNEQPFDLLIHLGDIEGCLLYTSDAADEL